VWVASQVVSFLFYVGFFAPGNSIRVSGSAGNAERMAMQDTGVDGTVLSDCEASHFSPIPVAAIPWQRRHRSIYENRRVSARQPTSFSLRRKEKKQKKRFYSCRVGSQPFFEDAGPMNRNRAGLRGHRTLKRPDEHEAARTG